MKDLRDLHATPNPGFDRSLGAAAERQRSAFVCPVSGLDASGFIQVTLPMLLMLLLPPPSLPPLQLQLNTIVSLWVSGRAAT
jgi:hypothetical protein